MPEQGDLGGDVERAFHRAASRFLAMFDGCLRQAQLYEPDNKILNEPIQRLSGILDEILTGRPHFAFQGTDENVFINGQRLRVDGTTYLKHIDFLKLLAARQVSGMVFSRTLDADQMKDALYALARFDRESAAAFEEVRASLQHRGLAQAIELTRLAKQAPQRRFTRVQVERRVFAIRSYAKAMLLLRLYIKHINDAVQRGYYHLKLQRAVQDLVTVCLEHGWKYFGLVNAKRHEDYLYNHSTNVAVAALVMGVQLGLRRLRLAELGMAAILHDLGKAFLPKELLEKPGTFTEDDRARLREHPLLGVEALLRVRQYNEALLKRIMVICEHHQMLGEAADPHLYSRIIAAAEAFDALTSDRPHRPAYLPDDAIRILLQMAGTRLDRDVVHAFVQTVGLYPSGSLVELSTGEQALVFHPNSDPREWKSPVVRILRDKSGAEVPRAPLVDLARKGGDGRPVRSIVRCLDPSAAESNASGFLYAEAEPSPGA